MTHRTRRFLVCAVGAGLLCGQARSGSVQSNPGRQSDPSPAAVVSLLPTTAPLPVTYDAFVERAGALQSGATRADVIAALGAPTEEGETFLLYSLIGLPGFPGLPGPVGVQVFPEARIELQAGRMVGPISWGWMDTTGSPPPSQKPR